MFDENELVQEQVQEQVEQQAPQESPQERNFREMRERNKQLERERDEERRQRIEMQNALTRQPQQQQAAPKQRMHRDDIPDVGYVEDELAAMREEQRKERERIAFAHAELKVAQKYPDYATALSDENIDKLKYQEPEQWASISGNPDPYTRMISAMKALKASGIYQKEEYIPEKKVAAANSAKPKAVNSLSPSSSGTGALAQAHNFTGRVFSSETEREDFLRQAQRHARGY